MRAYSIVLIIATKVGEWFACTIKKNWLEGYIKKNYATFISSLLNGTTLNKGHGVSFIFLYDTRNKLLASRWWKIKRAIISCSNVDARMH